MISSIWLSRGAVLGGVLAFTAAFSAGADARPPYRVLHNFHGRQSGGPNGGAPVFDLSGNLYGTAIASGRHQLGVVYRFGPDKTYSVLHVFGGPDGATPVGSVLYNDSDGRLFGTTSFGGSGTDASCGGQGCGVVYALDADGSETVLHSFDYATEGGMPVDAPVRDSDGNLYGVASAGGPAGYGTVWKLDSSGKLTVLHAFNYDDNGASPYAGLIVGQNGNFYGVDSNGGANFGAGTIFEISPSGTFNTLHSFGLGDGSYPDGAYPIARLVQDKTGNLYGAAYYGGPGGYGTVFKLAPDGTFSVLHAFSGDAGGGYPQSNLLPIKNALYGTTATGGDPNCNCGVVFKLGMDGTETVLHTFTGGPADGGFSYTGLARGAHGFLYGATQGGGKKSAGVLFRIKR